MKSIFLTFFALIATPFVLFFSTLATGTILGLISGGHNWYTFAISGVLGGAAAAYMQLSLIHPGARFYIMNTTLIILIILSVFDAYVLITDNAGEPYEKLLQTFGFPVSFVAVLYENQVRQKKQKIIT